MSSFQEELAESKPAVVEFGQVTPVIWLGENPEIPFQKGDDAAWHVFKFVLDKYTYLKEKMTNLPIRNSTDSPRANLLIRAAEWVREKGQVRPISEVPVLDEYIGILSNVIRRRKRMSLEILAKRSGYEIEELIAFEAGLLPRLRMCIMLPAIAKAAGLDHESLLQPIHSLASRFLHK
ncbi:MAG: hypothetical protein AB1750_04625 [Chloroflexota bacterium]